MYDQEQEENISRFVEITDESRDVAITFLEPRRWVVDDAVSAYYDTRPPPSPSSRAEDGKEGGNRSLNVEDNISFMPSRQTPQLSILRIVMRDFKSFTGDDLNFPIKNITALVGPTTVGKSDLVDALIFVLGVTTGQPREKKQRSRSAFVRLLCRTDTEPELSFQRTIPTSPDEAEYRINNKAVTSNEYNEKLQSLGILVTACNGWLLQGDFDSIACKNAKQLTELLEEISVSQKVKEKYEYLKEEKAKAEGNTARIQEELNSLKREDKSENMDKNEKKGTVDVDAEKSNLEEIGRKLGDELPDRDKQTKPSISKLKEIGEKLLLRIQDIKEEIKQHKSKLKKFEESLTEENLTTILPEELADRNALKTNITELNGWLSDIKAARNENITDQRYINLYNDLRSNCEGVCGWLSDFCSPKSGMYNRAVTVAMGRFFYAVVVENENAKEACIQEMDKRQEFLPMTFITRQSSSPSKPKFEIKSGGTSKPLCDFIESDPDYEEMVFSVFGNTLVCDELEEAKNLCWKDENEISCVAVLDGVLLTKSRTMTGGSAGEWDAEKLMNEFSSWKEEKEAAKEKEKEYEAAKEKEKEYEAAKEKEKEVAKKYDTVVLERHTQFMNAFEHIKSNVDKICKQLTISDTVSSSWTADMELENKVDPFLGGTNYTITPPTKASPCSMEDLSGGEKTVAALALLFSIHSYRPPPFMILNKVDAELDDEHKAGVSKYIHSKSWKAGRDNEAAKDGNVVQSIVVSPNDNFCGQMESVIGVYEDPADRGSKIVSVDLTNRQES